MEQGEGEMQAKKVWESVKFYAVRCGLCSKWRLIPSKEKYEEIRAKMGEEMFECERAREWRPQISCQHESDVEQDDDDFRWAMDRPNIPQTPSGWQRILRIRAEGGTKFADVYYVSPSNKRLRSMVELSRYLGDNPRYVQDKISLSQFSFQPPVPLDDKYVAKRHNRARGVHFASKTETGGNFGGAKPASLRLLLKIEEFCTIYKKGIGSIKCRNQSKMHQFGLIYRKLLLGLFILIIFVP